MAAMETKQSLSIESFSYSWLVNLKPSLESLEGSFRTSIDASDEASFIEMDPKLPPSKRFLQTPHDQTFDFPTSNSPLHEVLHADELIYNGYLMPLFIKPSKMEASNDNNMLTTVNYNKSLSDGNEMMKSSSKRVRCSSLRRCRRLSKQILLKYFEFLRPFCKKIISRGSFCKSAKVHGQEYYSSAAISPRTSLGYSVDNWRRSCDSESSIYEAVLHCKRTIGQ